MAHTSAILAAAQRGKKFLALPLFDGTDDSRRRGQLRRRAGLEEAGGQQVPARCPACPARASAWRSSTTQSKGEVPTYQVGMRYWENGVADNLQMDFGDFVMDAKMTELTPLPHKC